MQIHFFGMTFDNCRRRILAKANLTSQVYVDNELCGAVEWVATKSVYRIDCNGLSGSKIRITQEGQYLTLCEVQVLGELRGIF